MERTEVLQWPAGYTTCSRPTSTKGVHSKYIMNLGDLHGSPRRLAMDYNVSLGLIYALALAVSGMLVVWGLPMGAISLTRSLAALKARRARHTRRSAFHRRLRSQGVQPLSRAGHGHRIPSRAT
jgi:hypothetical protein